MSKQERFRGFLLYMGCALFFEGIAALVFAQQWIGGVLWWAIALYLVYLAREGGWKWVYIPAGMLITIGSVIAFWVILPMKIIGSLPFAGICVFFCFKGHNMLRGRTHRSDESADLIEEGYGI